MEKSDENEHEISNEAMLTSGESDHESFKQATETSDEVSDQETSSQAKKTDNVCKFCEKLFSRKSHLISHIFKDHACDDNSKDNSNEAFSEKGSLASREIGHLKKELKNEIGHLKKGIIEELKEMFMKQDEKLESLQREIQDLKKEHKNESLNNHENTSTPTKRKHQVLKEVSPTTTQPSKKSRQETLINEALEDNSDEDSSSAKKSKNKETNDICVKSVSKPKRRSTLSAHVRCVLCPNRFGAVKRTDTNSWAHVVCAFYIPEVRFHNVSTMEPIVLGLVPPERYGNVCTDLLLNSKILL